jgi:uncharacterized protein (TIGR02598 family)
MHGPLSTHLPVLANPAPPRSRSNQGFSLVEVTLAIGIIAFAFVALFGLLPTGLQTFRSSIDQTNDTNILQDINSMVQVTAWKNLDKLDTTKGGDIYYFDEEGRRTDTKQHASADRAVKSRRLYQVKLLVEKLYQPGTRGKAAADEIPNTRRISVIIGDLVRPKSFTDFGSIDDSEDLQQKNRPMDVRSRTFIITRMESEHDVQ